MRNTDPHTCEPSHALLPSPGASLTFVSSRTHTQTDRATSKKIAGKIIPAIATTTALVTGLVCLEFYKLLQGKPLEAYRNCYANLALPLFSFSEPMAPQRSGTEPRTFTVWDKAHFDGPLTLGQLVDAIEERFNVDVGVVSCGVAMLVSSFMNPAKARERRATR